MTKKNNPTERKQVTKFLSNLLEKDKFSGVGKYWAKEVTFDYGTEHPIRVDYMQFIPKSQLAIDGIEKGEFVCYEIKSCKEDFMSGYGQNFIGEKNYLIMTASTFNDLEAGGLLNLIPFKVGIMIAVPIKRKYHIDEELKSPTALDTEEKWFYAVIKPAHKAYRKRSISEMLFCMLRSVRN